MKLHFRNAAPTDIPICFEIERNSYPEDEAATLASLQYRQHHAAKYFVCALRDHPDGDPASASSMVGFICATRCNEFTHDTMTVHDPSGRHLAVHSVVVKEEYRRQGLGSALLANYVKTVVAFQDGIESLVLLAKSHLLGFYVNAGFSVLRPSDICHGKDLWYHLEHKVSADPGYPCWILDSFSEEVGQGNPAAVVLIAGQPSMDDFAWMRIIAMEFNLSETAFVWEIADNCYGIRFFTRNGSEVDLCGHATLASAAVIFSLKSIEDCHQSIAFKATKNTLQASPAKKLESRSKNVRRVVMDFPAKSVVPIEDTATRLEAVSMLERAFPHLAKELNHNIEYLGLDEDGCDLLVEVPPAFFSRIGFAGLNFAALMEWTGYSRGVIVCSLSDDDNADFVSRFFGPKVGINEDPVTGSAHCCLAPYFAAKLGRTSLQAVQKSQRGGGMRCEVGQDRVQIVGVATTVMSGRVAL